MVIVTDLTDNMVARMHWSSDFYFFASVMSACDLIIIRRADIIALNDYTCTGLDLCKTNQACMHLDLYAPAVHAAISAWCLHQVVLVAQVPPCQ